MDGLIWIRAQWDRLAAWGLLCFAVVLVSGATLRARDALYAPQQFSSLISGAIGALAVGALGSALLVSAAFHDEWRRLDRIEGRLHDAYPPSLAAPVSVTAKREASLGLWLRAECDRIVGWVLVVIAFGWLLLGYHRIADSLYAVDQIAYLISTGVAALLLLFSGAGIVLLADWKDSVHKLSRIASLRVGSPPSGDVSATRVVRAATLGPAVVLLLGVAAVALGWAWAADALRVERALDGLVLAGAGAAVVVVVLAAVAIRLRLTLRRRMNAVLSGMVTVDRQPVAAGAGFSEVSPSELWTADGLVRFHRASCPALLGVLAGRRPVRPTDAALEPCLICEAGE